MNEEVGHQAYASYKSGWEGCVSPSLEANKHKDLFYSNVFDTWDYKTQG